MDCTTERRQRIASLISYVLMALALVLSLTQKLLPGLLCACLGFVTTRGLTKRLSKLTSQRSRMAAVTSASIVTVMPLVLIALFLPPTRGLIFDAPSHYRELLAFMARTVLELREKLPTDIAAQLPDGAKDLQRLIASYLASKAGMLAITGRAWLSGLLFAYVGLLIGALAAIRPASIDLRPLAAALHLRLRRFGQTFIQIMVAQFWIALFNTFLTAVFLLVLLPLFDARLPYSPMLLMLTFAAGMIPIVGNLICNGVLTLVGLSVSPWVALACLCFLITIHKAEYFINARVIGQRTHLSVWELLAVMFVMDAVFGSAGLVSAPLFYAYAKKELHAAGWV